MNLLTMLSTPLLLLFITLIPCMGAMDDDYGQAMQLTLEHELTKGKFSPRAQLSVRSHASEHVTYMEDGQLTDDELRSLIALAEARDIYRIRVLFNLGNKADYVYGFVYACDLLNSGLRDNLTLTFNTHGQLVSLHIGLQDSSRAAFESCELALGTASGPAAYPRRFGTHAVALRPVQGPAPETQIYITRMEEEKRRKQEAEQGDNRSFLSKYWMYIVPAVVIFMMMSNAADPNAQGGGN